MHPALCLIGGDSMEVIIHLPRSKEGQEELAKCVATVHGKGNKTRQVPIMKSTVALLRSYLASYKGTSGLEYGENHLFVNQQGYPLSRWGVSHIISKYVQKAKDTEQFRVDFPITPHIFRHSKAMHMLHAGIKLI